MITFLGYNNEQRVFPYVQLEVFLKFITKSKTETNATLNLNKLNTKSASPVYLSQLNSDLVEIGDL